MKIVIFGAFLCFAMTANAANVQRAARNSGSLIPSIVEEILKVELKSDLKKNSAIEIEEKEPLIKEQKIITPVEDHIAEKDLKKEENEQNQVEKDMAIKTVEPIVESKTIEKTPEVVEKIVEMVVVEKTPENQVDNVRIESIPLMQPEAEIVKETVVIEPVSELRHEPVAVVITEEEVIKPMIRNVIKEEIPQIKYIPEEVNAKNEPISVVKEIKMDEVKSESVASMDEVKSESVASMDEVKIAEMPAMLLIKTESEVAPMMLSDEKMVNPEVKKEEIKGILKNEEVIKVNPEMSDKTPMEVMMSETAPGLRDTEDGRQQTIIQQIQQAAQNIPVVGPLLNRATQPPTEQPVTNSADETGSSTVASTTASAGPILQVFQGLTNTVSNILGANTNAATATQQDESQTQAPGLIQTAINNLQSNPLVNSIQSGLNQAFNNVQAATNNVLSSFTGQQTPNKPVKAEEKPSDPEVASVEEVEQVVEEVRKIEEPLKTAEKPVVIQKEEKKIEEKEDLVMN